MFKLTVYYIDKLTLYELKLISTLYS